MATSLSTAGPPSKLIHDSYGQSEPTTQTASGVVQPFSHMGPRIVPILYSGTPLPPFVLPMGDLDSGPI